MFNFDELNKSTGASFPEKEIIISVGKKQQTEEKYTEEEILAQSLKFTVSQASYYFSRLIGIYNKQISDGIKNLSINNMWVDLGTIARDATEHEVRVLERKYKNDKGTIQDITDLIKLRLNILRSSIPEINKMFDVKWLKDNYPTLIKEEDNPTPGV